MKSILFVEVQPVVCKLLDGVEQKAFVKKSTSTVREALKLIKEYKPEVIFLDFVLSDGSGLDVLRYVKDFGIKSRVIVITEFSKTDTILECQLEGAFDFIQKPIQREKLLEYVNTALSYPSSHVFQVSKSDANASLEKMKNAKKNK